MKKVKTRVLSFVLALLMAFSIVGVMPGNAVEAEAASVYWNPYSTWRVTYQTGDDTSSYSEALSIMGCSKASEIKNLKSSNKSVVKVYAKNGYVRAEYGDKAGKAVISCTVKGVKLKKTFVVRKYTNPLKTVKIGTKNITSKFNTKDDWRTSSSFKKKTLLLRANSGWVIKSVSIYNGSSSKRYTVNKTSFKKTISLTSSYANCYVHMYNEKLGISEMITITKTNYP